MTTAVSLSDLRALRRVLPSRFWPRFLVRASVGVFALGSLTRSAFAETTLTVDLSTTIRGVTHAASGSLYGVTETLPADVTGLIAPLHPNVFNNPAAVGAGRQQPVGDAIVVAGRVAPVGGRVSIRLADWFPGFYTFTTMADWFADIQTTVSRVESMGLTNIYGYELWNEPQGTYSASNPVPSFNDFWMQTFAEIRMLAPNAKIIGPSIAAYDGAFISSLYTLCKANNCLPDIVSWHELAGENLTADLTNYRALETQMGISPRPISINEYSGAADLTVEGQPGASAPMIAKFERFQVDSACISYWDVAHPGRLGSLLASNTTKNGGWWFYNWYGEMTGNMVSTTPQTPASPTALDGFASLDTSAAYASILLGGINDGTIDVVVKGFQSASFFGASVHAVVETVPFVNRTTEVTATTMVSAADYVVANDEITVPIAGADGTSGYRVYLTSAVDGGIADASAKDAAADAESDATTSADAAAPDATAPVDATIVGMDGAASGTDATTGMDATPPGADATASAADAAVPATDATAPAEAGSVDGGGSGSIVDAGGTETSRASGVDSGLSDASGSAAGCGCRAVGDAQRATPAGEWLLALLGLAGLVWHRSRVRRHAR
jgi:MYXO-CTERM domain-containing protein